MILIQLILEKVKKKDDLMSGWGSGRPDWSKEIMENCRDLSSTKLYKDKVIEKGMEKYVTSTWSSNGKVISSIGILATEDNIVIKYTVTSKDGSKDVEYTVPVVWTKCNIGGERPWFLCPGINCSRRVEKLYLQPGGTYFVCRHCNNLTYETSRTSGDEIRYNILKMQRIRKKLKGDTYIYSPFPEPPKWMRWEKYLMLLREYEKLSQIHTGYLSAHANKVLWKVQKRVQRIRSGARL